MQEITAYDWRSLRVPEVGDFQPELRVSVVIPAYDCQDMLDRTLAALGAQRYPSQLLDVTVVDDGSPAPLKLSELAPANSRILRLERETEWGSARARHAGAMASDGDVLLFLDADMVTFPDHVAAHARWHHVTADAVTLGHKLFVDFGGITAQDVAEAAARDQLFELCADRPHQIHDWIERLIERTHDLTDFRPELFTAAVTATIGMRRALYAEAGGFRTHLRSGEDMEFGYRLMTAGAVFIPEPGARSWHQGEATYMSRAEEVRRRNNPNFANYIPLPGRFRPWTPGRTYAVPRVAVLVPSLGTRYEATKQCVDAVLGGDEHDVRVEICHPVDSPEIELLQAQYEHDPRVLLREDVPDTGFPSPFTAMVPEWVGLGPAALSTILDVLEAEQLGAVHVIIPGLPPADGTMTVWRTAALHRARRGADGSEPIEEVVGRTFGERWLDGGSLGIVDLRNQRLPRTPTVRPSLPALVQQLEQANAELARQAKLYAKLRARYEALAEVKVALKAVKRKYRKLKARKVVRVLLKVDAVKGRLRARRAKD